MEPELGLPPNSNQLRAYSPRWAELFEVDASKIRAVLGDLVRDVQHVGSTAVPGLSAKPILDIAVGLDRLNSYRQCVAPLSSIGYEHAHWAGLERDEVTNKRIALHPLLLHTKPSESRRERTESVPPRQPLRQTSGGVC